MTTVLDILLTELSEERDMLSEQLARNETLELEQMRHLQGRIRSIEHVIERVNDLRRSPEDLDDDDDDEDA